jgi:arylsulfatase A-like enzyme
MMKTDLNRIVLGLIWGLMSFRLIASAQDPGAARPPNIVFILTDDLGWGDPAIQGHPYMQTPCMDALARQGTLFRQFYVASPICSCSRVAFMTGHYPSRHHFTAQLDDHKANAARGMPDWLDTNVITITALLKKAGYATAHFGKWHIGGGPGSAPGAPTPADYGIDVSKTDVSAGPHLKPPKPDRYFRAHSTEYMDVEAIRFMKANRDRPFYINFWTLLPHAVLDPTPDQLKVYEDLNPDPENPAFKGPFRSYLKHAPNLKSQMQVYCASVTGLDAGIGLLLKAIDDLGLASNTIVVFSSDNGPEDYHFSKATNAGVGSPGPFNGRKRSLYEGGIRTPLVVRWPGHVPPGRIDTDSVISAVDYLPTICRLAGVALPPDLSPDGEDVSEILMGASRPRTKPLYFQWLWNVLGNQTYLAPELAVRDGQWKLFMYPDRTEAELYDMSSDSTETVNIAANHPEVVSRLSDELSQWESTLPAVKHKRQNKPPRIVLSPEP